MGSLHIHPMHNVFIVLVFKLCNVAAVGYQDAQLAIWQATTNNINIANLQKIG